VVTATEYVPDRGDVVWLSFEPQAGREQAGRRPALVLTPATYQRVVGLAVCCPVTRRAKGYPFEVVLPEGMSVAGVVLADHVKSLDWRARGAELADHAPAAVTARVIDLIGRLLG
jgi:mRNA interferase MazF